MYNKNNIKKMITTNFFTAQLKSEVLTAIGKANFEFEQNFKGDQNSSANDRKEIESENFNITIELCENVKWSSFRDYDFCDLQLTYLAITDENCDEFQDEFTSKEIINAINY